LINFYLSAQYIVKRLNPETYRVQIPGKSTSLGALGFKVEAAGKLRVFAMVDF